jgi:hypothetical protein
MMPVWSKHRKAAFRLLDQLMKDKAAKKTSPARLRIVRRDQ